jgi:dephospho-CoA kinase
MQRHGSIERPFLHETAEFYRKTAGPEFFVKELLNEYDGTSRGLIISGLRAMGEADAIRGSGGVIVFIDAPSELRYARMQARARDGESIVSYDEFLTREKSEWHNGDEPGDFSFKNLKASADHILLNGHDTEEFFSDAVRALGL